MENYNFNTIYRRLSEAQIKCFGSNHLNELQDLISYNMQILEEFDNFTTIEKEQINNFSVLALIVSKDYKEMLNYSLA